jgi:6,7-dimethyl-8-ribityllumazine synthase
LRVPGLGELPYVANMTASSGEVDCVIALGVVIAGDTPHHEIIAQSTAHALQDIAIRSEVPVINGIIVTNNLTSEPNNVAQVRCNQGNRIWSGRTPDGPPPPKSRSKIR